MTEYETYVEKEYEDDVNINFSIYSEEERREIAKRILEGKNVTFSDVPLYFAGDVLVYIEPHINEGNY